MELGYLEDGHPDCLSWEYLTGTRYGHQQGEKMRLRRAERMYNKGEVLRKPIWEWQGCRRRNSVQPSLTKDKHVHDGLQLAHETPQTPRLV